MSAPQIPALLGRYRPQTIIGRGGEASVFRATDEILGREVAIKLYRAAGDEQMAQFRTEQSALTRLSHHGIVSLIDAGIDYTAPRDPRPFLVMELVSGNDLAAILRERTLTTAEISEIAYDVAEALEYVHANGVVHRDIKPENVMLVEYGTTASRARARLTDFGIAGGILASSQNEEEGTTTTGTAAYLSPEQASLKTATPASDIYSLGLVLLECFTRRVAYPGGQVESALARLNADPPVPDDLPGEWTALLRAMTAREPAARPTAAHLIASSLSPASARRFAGESEEAMAGRGGK